MKHRKLQEIYDRDPNTKAYIILLSLDTYEDVFHDWDPSPYKKRDLEGDFLDFLWNSVEDIPSGANVVFEFTIPIEQKNEQKELLLISAIQNHFDYLLWRNQRKWSREYTEALKNVAFGTILLLLTYWLQMRSDNLFSRVLSDGLFVGAWVFIWQAFLKLFVDPRELRDERKIISRSRASTIRFVYRTQS